jgi:hypothetical protein
LSCAVQSYTGLVVIKDTAGSPTPFSLTYTGGLGLLGFTSTQALSAMTSFTSGSVPGLYSETAYFFLRVGNMCNPNYFVNNNQYAVSFLIPHPDFSSSSVGELIDMTTSNDKQILVLDSPISLNQFTVTLYDQDYNVVNLNGANYYFKLKLWIEKS